MLQVGPSMLLLLNAEPLQAQIATTTAPGPAQLAKYDANKNGRLDPEELAALQADETTARTVATSSAVTAAAGEAVQMSPFEVVADSRGYFASNTLSGTRLNSKIEDLGASITVVTKQQLLDTAALDINDIFLFEANTEGTAQFTDQTVDFQGRVLATCRPVVTPTACDLRRSSHRRLTRWFRSTTSIRSDQPQPNSSLAGLGGGTVNLNQSRASGTTQLSTGGSTNTEPPGGNRLAVTSRRLRLGLPPQTAEDSPRRLYAAAT